MTPEDAASFTMLKEQLESVLHTLSPQEERVIQLRFGLLDGHPRTLNEVGREFHLTRERIRQIAAKALFKLQDPSRAQKLHDYLGVHDNASLQDPPASGGNAAREI